MKMTLDNKTRGQLHRLGGDALVMSCESLFNFYCRCGDHDMKHHRFLGIALGLFAIPLAHVVLYSVLYLIVTDLQLPEAGHWSMALSLLAFWPGYCLGKWIVYREALAFARMMAPYLIYEAHLERTDRPVRPVQLHNCDDAYYDGLAQGRFIGRHMDF